MQAVHFILLVTDVVSDTPTGQRFPVVTDDVTPQRLLEAGALLSAYFSIIEAMLRTPTPWRVSLPCKYLLSLMCQACDVSPDSVVKIAYLLLTSSVHVVRN